MKELVSKNILLVDDQRNFLTVFGTELRGCGSNFCVLTAEDGAGALKVLDSARVDLVVTDLRMPVMNGYDLISHMKKNYPSIPVIVISSFLNPESKTRLRALGVSECIEKHSLTVSALEDMIHKGLQGAS